MPPRLYWFCWLVAKLDYIPRYGRYYTLMRMDGTRPSLRGKPHWRWSRWGRWGFNILMNWNLFFLYVDEWNRRRGIHTVDGEVVEKVGTSETHPDVPVD